MYQRLASASELLDQKSAPVAREIVELDRDRTRAKAVVTDLRYGAALSSAVQIRDGEYADLAGAALVIRVPRVLSTGTYLDSLRFRFHVARHLHVDPASCSP